MCKSVNIVFSIFAGIVAALLFYFGLLPNFIVIIKVAIVLAILMLLVFGAIAVFVAWTRSRFLLQCLCNNGYTLVIAIVAALILALVAISVDITLFLTWGAILFFFTVTALIMMILAFASFIMCVIKTDCKPCSCNNLMQ